MAGEALAQLVFTNEKENLALKSRFHRMFCIISLGQCPKWDATNGIVGGCLVLLAYLRACDAVERARRKTWKKEKKNYSYLYDRTSERGRVSARYAWCERRIVNWVDPASIICSSQRWSHACLSISTCTVKLWMTRSSDPLFFWPKNFKFNFLFATVSTQPLRGSRVI